MTRKPSYLALLSEVDVVDQLYDLLPEDDVLWSKNSNMAVRGIYSSKLYEKNQAKEARISYALHYVVGSDHHYTEPVNSHCFHWQELQERKDKEMLA